MNVIIAGERYSSNLGDPIISEAVEYILKKNINDVKISYLDLSGRKNYEIEKETNLITKAKKSSLKMKISKMLTKYHIDLEYLRFKRAFLEIEKTLFKDLNFDHIDLIIFPGGQLFKDTFIFQTEKIVKFAQENKIPVVFNSIGYGEIRSKKMRLILKRTLLLDNVTHISTRDDQDSIINYLIIKKKLK